MMDEYETNEFEEFYYQEEEQQQQEIIEKFKCEICREDVKLDTNYEFYIDHLIQHDHEEIKKKVRIIKVLNTYGFDSPIQSYDYNIIQCKLCENIVLNLKDIKIKHINVFHRIEDYFELNDLFDFPSNYVSDFNFELCDCCGILMENSYVIKDLHNKLIHFNFNNQEDVNEILFCCFCKLNSNHPDHFHHSFISKSSELANYFLQKKKVNKAQKLQSSSPNLLDSNNILNNNRSKFIYKLSNYQICRKIY